VVNTPEELDRSFAALAHPIRRRIVERLAEGPATVGATTGGWIERQRELWECKFDTIDRYLKEDR
jgi:DNA-binding transcriptional ArsR family regulator